MTEADASIAAFIEALRPIKCRQDLDYKPIDRFRDFSAVFGSDAGKRVLSQIIDFSEGESLTEMSVESHARLAWRAGMRRVGQWVSAMATIAPRSEG